MISSRLDPWLRALGYASASPSLHRAQEPVPQNHPYAPELRDLLSPEGEIRAHAVFDVDGVPAITFVVAGGLPRCVIQSICCSYGSAFGIRG